MQDVQKNNDQQSRLSRRDLMASAAAAAVAISAGTSTARAASPSGKFKLKYAPNFGQFRQHAGNDLIDQLKFMADQGFSAMFDNGMMRKPKYVQEKIANEMSRLDMTLGPFVLYADFGKKSFVTRDPEIRKMLVDLMKQGVAPAENNLLLMQRGRSIDIIIGCV